MPRNRNQETESMTRLLRYGRNGRRARRCPMSLMGGGFN
jgi:hypothetical protein